MPVFNDIPLRPGRCLIAIDMQDDMVVVAHDGIGGNIDSKNTGQFKQTIFNPLPAVFKALTDERIFTAQKGAANTARNAMIIGGGFKRHQCLP